jgi:magnesium chelatase subunit D
MEEPSKLDDVVLAAALASIPAGLLAKLQTAFPLKARKSAQGRAGELRNAALRGRAIGARAGDIGSGARLNVVETLRNAAPRQALRHQQGDSGDRRIAIRREDFRVVRYKHRSETATIFVVDASGSSAVHRMAEAKGAIELLLADCYIRRDQVALISFRGRTAELVLPPTRSLARAKRTLASLPGGGGTPLAAAIDAGFFLADSLRRKGVFPTLVFLTDGRANVGRGATQSRDAALDEAYHAARACRVSRLSVLVVDTSPQPGPAAERLATEIGGRYLALPYADAAVISQTIRRISPGDASPGLH